MLWTEGLACLGLDHCSEMQVSLLSKGLCFSAEECRNTGQVTVSVLHMYLSVFSVSAIHFL